MTHLINVSPCTQVSDCKVCAGKASLYGVVDFNKNCEEQRGRYLPLTGVPIYYHHCKSCGLVFTTAFDRWAKGDYLTHIYNEQYVDVDPDYIESRPAAYSEFVREFLFPRPRARHLDYGGGNGRLSSLLCTSGFDSATWDPMDSTAEYPTGLFGVVTAFEVFEHTPTPIATLKEIVQLCDTAAPLIFFSTYTIDALPPRSMDFWYLAPRNGHITIYTEASLQALFKIANLSLHHYGNGFHLAHRGPLDAADLELFTRFYRRGRLRRGISKIGRMIGVGRV